MDRPLKIAMIAACPFPFARGTPVRIERMSEALAARGHQVDVLTYHLGDDERSVGSQYKTIRIGSIPTYRKVSAGPSIQKLILCDPMLARLTRKTLKADSYDVIHAHHYEGLLVGLYGKRGLNVPLVYDAHTRLTSELHYYGLSPLRPLKRFLGKRLDGVLPAKADHIAAVTQDIAAKLRGEDGVAADKISVVINGVECDHFAVSSSDVSPDSNTLVFTGNLAPYQGVEHMFRALAIIRKAKPDARLLLVSNEQPDAYRGVIEELNLKGSFDCIGASFKELPLAMARGVVALNPRVECDGVPQKLLNYMANGRAVVSFAGSSKILRHNDTGLIVNDADHQAMADACVQLMDDRDQAVKLGDAAQRYVRENHSWVGVAAQLEAIYSGLLR